MLICVPLPEHWISGRPKNWDWLGLAILFLASIYRGIDQGVCLNNQSALWCCTLNLGSFPTSPRAWNLGNGDVTKQLARLEESYASYLLPCSNFDYKDTFNHLPHISNLLTTTSLKIETRQLFFLIRAPKPKKIWIHVAYGNLIILLTCVVTNPENIQTWKHSNIKQKIIWKNLKSHCFSYIIKRLGKYYISKARLIAVP